MTDHVAVLQGIQRLLVESGKGTKREVSALDHAIATCEQHAALVARLGEAPVVEIDSSGDVVTLIAEGSGLDNALLSARIDAMHGKHVRIVPEGGGDGR